MIELSVIFYLECFNKKTTILFGFVLDGENIVGHTDYHEQAYKYYKGFEYQEPYDENYIDSDGKQKKRVAYKTKLYIPSFKDRKYYGKKFIDQYYATDSYFDYVS